MDEGMNIPVSTKLTVEDAKAELAEIEAWLADVQHRLPQAQQRGMWLTGYLAALSE